MSEPQFSPSDQIARRERVWADFMEHVLRLPWAFVSNGSRLSDFEGLMPPEELEARVQARYDLTLEPRHLEMLLPEFLDLLQPPLQA
jgi:hypothetical protein